MVKFFTIIFLLSNLLTCANKSVIVSKKSITSISEVRDSILKKSRFKTLILKKRFQSNYPELNTEIDQYEIAINSPKSVIFSIDGKKFYINSLEGYSTVVFDAQKLIKVKEIVHTFDVNNNDLFFKNESTAFDYKYHQEVPNVNHFSGKPVESCLSHNGKYLWVTYYRRDWDENAESPSAVAIIDTQTDKIVRVMPTGPLPKMIACSPNNKYIAVTHWGDNTVGIIDISSDNVFEFSYKTKIVIDNQLSLKYDKDQKIDRDNDCGNCLRGTVFTPDSKTLLVAKMGGNGIAKISTKDFKYNGTLTGMKANVRHLVINNKRLFLSSNKFGFVQSIAMDSLLESKKKSVDNLFFNKNWQTTFVGIGARTIDVSKDGKYVFACVNNDNKISVLDAKTMSIIYSAEGSKYPVGMALSPNGKMLVVTSQGKENQKYTGNAVSVYEIVFQ